MSTQDSQEHSLVKVLFDFQYKTNEGREISIKKNERLVLLQKTNIDWWQVFRTHEQRSFYVPATYVREISILSRKNSEEERDNTTMDPSEGPIYKNMPKETTSAIKNVKKWLAGAMECTQDASKSHESYDDYKKYNAIDYQTRAELKVGLAAIKSKSLERDMKNTKINLQCDNEIINEQLPLNNNPSTSTTKFDHTAKVDIPTLQDNNFRKELENSLDRRNQRKLSTSKNDYDKIIQENRDIDTKTKLLKTRIRTVSSRSDDSQIDSDIDDKFEIKKLNTSLHDELKDKLSPSNSKRNSRSLDFEIKKFSQRNERSPSPKPVYGRQLTIAGSNINDENIDNNIKAGNKILYDKRSTWAVEELMTELTQMCKERVVTNKTKNISNLKSIEIKPTTFDPHDELTRELHEMNLQRSGGNTPQIENRTIETTSSSPSTSNNISKISINQSDKLRIEKIILHKEDEQQKLSPTNKFTFTFKNNDIPSSSTSTSSTTTTTTTTLSSPQIKPLKSPKSPKILDEYNEANILNDSPTSPNDSLDNTHLLSAENDKISRINNFIKQELNPIHETPSYSNIKLSEQVKLRTKLKMKNDETQSELKLTPSLEKLASEIKFIPSKKTTNDTDEINKNKVKINNNNYTLINSSNFNLDNDKNHENDNNNNDTFDDSGIVDESITIIDNNDDKKCENNYLKFKKKFFHTGSFKTKREGKYFYKNKDFNDDYDDDDGWKNCLKRTTTMHCTTVPESSRRHKRFDNIKYTNKLKRKSRSLSDLNLFDDVDDDDDDADEDDDNLNEENLSEYDNCGIKINHRRPVPLPRKLIPSFVDKNKNDKLKNFDYHTDEDIWIARDDIYPSKSSTAVGFKSLLSPSDSGSDNCLQSKELLNDHNDDIDKKAKNKKMIRESFSDELVLSSNASSEALQSQSESEITPASQQSPVDIKTPIEGYEYDIELPPGWIQKYDSQLEQMSYFNKQGDRWFSSHDAEGKIYFFEENSNESFWVLPTKSKDQLVPTKPSTKTNRLSSSSPKFIPPPSINTTKTKINSSNTYTNTSPSPSSSSSLQQTSNISSPILHYENLQQKKLTASTTTTTATITEWPQLSFDGNMKIIKEGQINRTKITENGKKLRKNWSTSHAVLTELFLLFFKDSKTFSTMIKSGQCQTAKPDISVDLNGARIELGDRASSRKNVYIISTVLGLQVLIQSDNTLQSNEWYQDIDTVIKKLPSQTKTLVDYDGIRKISNSKLDKQQSEINQDDSKKDNNKVSRSRSMKIKRLDDSIEDLPSVNEKIKIKAKLRRFFLRRPSVESLVKDGIYKNEPAFGSSLQDVCPNSSPRIPAFVKRCIEVLESNEDNMKTDGLYRASGNLSQIQKIRLQIDQDKLNVLSQEEDVHVLTGALKLFFRELKEPLIPSCFFKEALNASMLKKHTTKVQCFRDIIKLFPSPNYDTLQYLLKHLLKVTTYQEFNRMHIPNLAIVFGPTLMWPAEESPNMALDLMQQNLVIECLLSEYNKIFK